MVRHSLENAVKQLAGASYNESFSRAYKHPARTRDQLLQDPSVQKVVDEWKL